MLSNWTWHVEVCKLLHKNPKQQLSLDKFFKKGFDTTSKNKTFQLETVASSQLQEPGEAINNGLVSSTPKVLPTQEPYASNSGDKLAHSEMSASIKMLTNGGPGVSTSSEVSTSGKVLVSNEVIASSEVLADHKHLKCFRLVS